MRRLALLAALTAAVPLAAQVQTLSPFQQAKARDALRDQLPCLGCHELDGSGGRTAPTLDGVASRRGAAWVRAMIVDPQRTRPGAAMPRVPMPDALRDLIIAYLGRDAASVDAPIQQPPAASAPAAASNGTQLYARWCASCHGARGEGDGPNAKYLPVPPARHASGEAMSKLSDDVMFDAIAGGGRVMGLSPRMPPFGATLSNAEIRSLVGYIRTLCACAGPAWSTDDRR
ncbi:MAG TPA: cytochrome c [Gemmatimonadaceae bacterium]|nr:cytochrome c [Gemmatimonadaceae bacterium]